MSQIGSSLRAARQDLGASIADISRETRIPAYHIEAIEHEDFGALPAPVYVRGFIRNYAKAVGLQPEALVGELGPEWRKPTDPRPSRAASFTLATANFGGVARPASDGWGGIRRERAPSFPDDHLDLNARRADDAPGVLTASSAPAGRGFSLPQVHLPRVSLPVLPAIPALRWPRLPGIPRPALAAPKLPGLPALPAVRVPVPKMPAMPSLPSRDALPAIAIPAAPSRRTTLYMAAGALAVGVITLTGVLLRDGLTNGGTPTGSGGDSGALVAASETSTPAATATTPPTMTATPPPTAIPTPTPEPVPPPPALPVGAFAYCTSLGGGNYSCGDQPWRVICAPGGYFFDPQGIIPRPIPVEWEGWSETTLTERLEYIHGVC